MNTAHADIALDVDTLSGLLCALDDWAAEIIQLLREEMPIAK